VSIKDEFNRRLKERVSKDFVCLEDGYKVWWPGSTNGYLNADHLRMIAKLLDEENKDWDEQVTRDVG